MLECFWLSAVHSKAPGCSRRSTGSIGEHRLPSSRSDLPGAGPRTQGCGTCFVCYQGVISCQYRSELVGTYTEPHRTKSCVFSDRHIVIRQRTPVSERGHRPRISGHFRRRRRCMLGNKKRNSMWRVPSLGEELAYFFTSSYRSGEEGPIYLSLPI